MLCMLFAYDAAGNVIATLDYMVARDDSGAVAGLIDFEAYEAVGGRLRDIWQVSNAIGSATWPEWIGAQAHEFRVELSPDQRVAALVHRVSGQRRERAAIEAAIAAVEPDEYGRRDLRDILGGPGMPLRLDKEGRTLGRSPVVTGTPPGLPLLDRSY